MEDTMQSNALVQVRESNIGLGVFALDRFEPGECLGAIEGEVSEVSEGTTQYSAEYSDNQVIEVAPPFRYLNHSCAPNCQLEQDEDVGGLVVVVLSPIAPGDELTIDYAWGAQDAIPCRCGAENCRGWVVCGEELDQITSQPQPCSKCGQDLCWERLEFLLETRKEITCVECSREAPRLVLVDLDDVPGYAELVPEDKTNTRKGRVKSRRVDDSDVLE